MPRKIDNKAEEVKVFCCDCARWTRDTSGISYSADTREYFMGECAEGITDGGFNCRKTFANKPRTCVKHRRLN